MSYNINNTHMAPIYILHTYNLSLVIISVYTTVPLLPPSNIEKNLVVHLMSSLMLLEKVEKPAALREEVKVKQKV